MPGLGCSSGLAGGQATAPPLRPGFSRGSLRKSRVTHASRTAVFQHQEKLRFWAPWKPSFGNSRRELGGGLTNGKLEAVPLPFGEVLEISTGKWLFVLFFCFCLMQLAVGKPQVHLADLVTWFQGLVECSPHIMLKTRR